MFGTLTKLSAIVFGTLTILTECNSLWNFGHIPSALVYLFLIILSAIVNGVFTISILSSIVNEVAFVCLFLLLYVPCQQLW